LLLRDPLRIRGEMDRLGIRLVYRLISKGRGAPRRLLLR
jgi:hypothetical protein